LLFCYGLGSHIERWWETPTSADSLVGLASFSRLTFFDRRGTGASDGVPSKGIPTWEEWTEDISAVMDAAGLERTAILAVLDAGPIAMLFAAMHPEQVSALVLLNTTARYVVADDYPIGASPEAVEVFLEVVRTTWGTLDFARAVNPGKVNDPEFLSNFVRTQRSSATPRSAVAQYNYILRNDVRQALPLIRTPTLVLHAESAPVLPIEHGQYLAEHIEGARFEAIPGGDLGMIMLPVLDEISEFLTGERPAVHVDRILTTVLFTDIVGSTDCAARLGDQRWSALLDAHDRMVRDALRRFRGHEINTTGDGFVASFDGPARAIRCATDMMRLAKKLELDLRVGIHTGECEVRGDDLSGLAVHVAARVAALAAPGEVLVSATAKDLVVGSGLEFDNRGEHKLKGVPGAWKLFAVRV